MSVQWSWMVLPSFGITSNLTIKSAVGFHPRVSMIGIMRVTAVTPGSNSIVPSRLCTKRTAYQHDKRPGVTTLVRPECVQSEPCKVDARFCSTVRRPVSQLYSSPAWSIPNHVQDHGLFICSQQCACSRGCTCVHMRMCPFTGWRVLGIAFKHVIFWCRKSAAQWSAGRLENLVEGGEFE